ncbi:hypothetical protein DXA02_02150 [Ruminococcus sp. AM54-1NS]|nr:hypothetical protein DXA02_02150 [Ruminococcus sp. AM54-1NS]RGH33974.1 hypothetical protein DW938_13375 [Ruminococcus sp. AM43-6]
MKAPLQSHMTIISLGTLWAEQALHMKKRRTLQMISLTLTKQQALRLQRIIIPIRQQIRQQVRRQALQPQ